MKRLMSLDAYRGLVIAGMISGGLGMRHLVDKPVLGQIVRQFLHTDWHGVTFYDLVFPSFLFIVGAALPFSYAKRKSLGMSDGQITWSVIRRTVILFLLGSLRTSSLHNHPALVELSSALQPIAIAYLVSFFFLRKSMVYRAVVSGIIVAVYWMVLEFVPAPGIPAGTLEKNHNLVWYVDMLVLGRAHPDGWGTLLLFFPQMVNTLCGTIAGDLVRGESSPAYKVRVMGLVSLACLVSGRVADRFMPIIMKLWTPAYVLFTVGCSFLFLLLFYWLIDVRDYRRWAFPLVVFGMNAIALYMGNSLFGGRLAEIVDVFLRDAVAALGPAGPPFRFFVLLVVKWLIFFWL